MNWIISSYVGFGDIIVLHSFEMFSKRYEGTHGRWYK